MIRGKRILAVVPARGGSKGLPRKNLQQLDGVPLVARVGFLVQKLPMIDRGLVSTDSPEIAEIARGSGLAAPFFRPAEISGDRIGDWEVLHHALVEIEKIDQVCYDLVVMLQPTCPLRKTEHVEKAVVKLIEEELDSVWTVSEIDPKFHPLKIMSIDPSGKLEHYDPAGRDIVARQQLKSLYYRDGAAYVMTRQCILEQKTIFGEKAGAILNCEALIDIDSRADLELAEWHLQKTKGHYKGP